mmetsp:Transcript_15062/g.28317  ORF Transcript_15062/g.28317 Transcript_15062/m.28317 type:complete len:295 (+) Transcript_15062:1-885(+)
MSTRCRSPEFIAPTYVNGGGGARLPRHHWAARVDVHASEDFALKGIPMEKEEEELGCLDTEGLPAIGERVQAAFTLAMTAFSDALNKTRSSGQGFKPTDPQALTSKFARRWQIAAGISRRSSNDSASNTSAAPEPPRSDEVATPADATSPSPSRPSTRCSRQAWAEHANKRPVSRQSTTSPSLARSLTPLSSKAAGSKKAERDKWLKRPVQVQELVHARAPTPINTASDYPPIFRRIFAERPFQSHYEYFAKQCPDTSPQHRHAMKQRTVMERAIATGLERRRTGRSFFGVCAT